MKRGILSATIVAMAACSGLAQNDGVIREGSGERRAALDAMELSTFDRDLLGGLTDWVGEPVTADDLDGRPVLILTWASWHPGSVASARAAQLMSRTFADQDLLVLGVHSDEGYDTAAETAERLRLDFPIARDADSKFRQALKVDMDPNFYVVDRAGQIRFADIIRNSVRDAVKIVATETREEAQTAAQRREGNDAPRSRVIESVARGDVANIPEWGIQAQDALLYEDAEWPTRWRAFEEAAQADYGQRRSNEPLPIVDFDSQLMTWLRPKPELGGRVRVVYFWAPSVNRSYQEVQPFMDELQRRHGRDIAVIGAAVPIVSVDGYDESAMDEAIEKYSERLTGALQRSSIDHSIMFDREFELVSSTLGKENYGTQMARELARGFVFPIAVIYSTDNSVRWVGDPLDDRFRVALNRIIEVDPAVQVRQQRDAAFLSRQR